MLSQPLFWLYLFLLFQIFIFLTNRVSFHPRWRISEHVWVPVLSLIFLAIVWVPNLPLFKAWDFTTVSWWPLPLFPKAMMALYVLWALTLWVDHTYWVLFRKKPVQFRFIYREKLKMPSSLKAPFGFLKHVGFENQLYSPEVVEYEVRLPHWPKEFDGLSIVQLSDIHVGKYINRVYLQAVVERAKRIKADIFALTGDFISFPKEIPLIAGLLKGFKARLGVYAVLGNHDHWADGPAMKRALEKDGIRVLVNDVIYHRHRGKTLAILGSDDHWEGDQDHGKLLKAKGDARIFLAHQPDHLDLGEEIGAHLQLSGHCHGGQICFPFLGPLIVPAEEGRKYAGGFIREKDTTLFVHRGIGGFPPLRTYCPPEIVKLVLRSGKTS